MGLRDAGQWMTSYLPYRSQGVYIEGSMSRLLPLEANIRVLCDVTLMIVPILQDRRMLKSSLTNLYTSTVLLHTSSLGNEYKTETKT